MTPAENSDRLARGKPLAAGLLAAAIWGGMYVVSDVVLETIPPFMLLTLRLLLGIVSLWVLTLRSPAQGGPKHRRLQVLGVGMVGYGISLGFQFVGTKLSTAANGALLTSATPAFVAVFAVWLLGEKLTFRRIAALLLATSGVLIVLDPRNVDFSSDLFLGNLSLIGAALTWGLYSVLVRKVSQGGMDMVWMTLWVLIGGLPIAGPAAAWEWVTLGLGVITPATILGVLYLGIVSTAVAMFLWNYAFARLEANTASLTFFAQPIVGALLSAVFLEERLGLGFFLGGALIGAGIWFSSRISR
jgi:drug/metabolite transporter (DMT)-like permease